MTPRNPEESPEETTQDEVLQAINEVLSHDTEAPVVSVPENTPVLNAQPKETPDTKVELDRIELYLRGPTAFSA
ncbi:hypothetical protein AA309_06890 [Microvirga vignae]|uniref:Uncharacterized protein n=1 Tax=Microvirga vignae TaxID=1225564 RepID=A0A0H1RF65_9HYPH|nr:hypothetical protein [Microvirga vignae]KLK93749.1 hypothetical protein AA309_06890 [Microvirga vignae]